MNNDEGKAGDSIRREDGFAIEELSEEALALVGIRSQITQAKIAIEAAGAELEELARKTLEAEELVEACELAIAELAEEARGEEAGAAG